MTLQKRILLLALVCCIQTIYIPTSNRLTGGIVPKLPIDIFPIWSIWVLPYVLCYLLWLGSIAWVIFKVEDRAFRSFIAGCILMVSLGAITFVVFPTYVPAATLEGSDIFTVLLRAIHENWGRYSALPSGHVYITTLIALFCGRWYPSQRTLWTLVVVIVSLSTLLTGQHYILDVVGGLLVALAGYRFGLWWTGIRASEKKAGEGSRKRIVSSLN